MKPQAFRSCLVILLATFCVAGPANGGKSGQFRNGTILIIRHAEKPESGSELSLAGQKRASAYVNYFKTFTLDSNPLTLNFLFATAVSKHSERPLLTITPLGEALKLPINHDFNDDQCKELAKSLRSGQYDGKNILICWHHGKIPKLLQHLGAEPNRFLPKGNWPDDAFCWVIQLRYDENGQLIAGKSMVINENLMPGDSVHNIVGQ